MTMPRPVRPAFIPERSGGGIPRRPNFPKLIGAALLAAAPSLQARLIFADYQVLPAEREVDVLVWMTPEDPARPAFLREAASPLPNPGDSSAAPGRDSLSASADLPAPTALAGGSTCAPAGDAWRISSCRVSEPHPQAGPREAYLHWAFLNLGNSTRRADLTAREEHRRTLDALTRPLVAFRKRKDSCDYLILHKDSYAPAAGGRLACPDLAAAFSGLETDLADRMNRPRRLHVSQAEKLIRPPATSYLDGPAFLEAGCDALLTFPVMLSGDTEEQHGPFTTSTEVFDLDDMASHAFPPVAGKMFFTFRRTVGFRIGYEYARLVLENDLMAALKSDVMANHSRRLDDWRIRRHTLSGELMFGRNVETRDAQVYLGGLIGLGQVDYSETATVDGREENVDGFLKDVTGVLLGAQARVLFKEVFQIGAEMGLCIKEFALRASDMQPDGSATELQFRLTLGLQKTFHLTPKDG